MNSIVRKFHLEEVNEKQYLIYHLDSLGESLINSNNTDKNYISVPPLFLCPEVRSNSLMQQFMDLYIGEKMNDIHVIQENESSDDNNEIERLDLDNPEHYVLPLFWCKNNDDEDNNNNGYDSCQMCYGSLKIGTDYYFCVKNDEIYHKECVEFPPEIKHPYHPQHPLKLSLFKKGVDCAHCRTKEDTFFGYHCIICNVSMNNTCAMKPIPFVIEKAKRHDHSLTFFTRKDHLRCNVCGLIDKNHQTYVCLKCDFVVHQDCVDSPNVIRISRHHHRISFTSSLLPGKWSCGVCRKDVDGEYGAYTCKKCDGFVVHPKCALRKDIWDGKELEGVPEEDDIEEILEPFERISDGRIFHFLHNHYLKPKICGEIYDESKICHACVLPIYEGKFYSCMECDFILHDYCANAPRKKRHPLHPHPLTLKVTSEYDDKGYFKCDACYRRCSGFVYEHNIEEKYFRLDVRCGSIPEPFVYQGHEHPLFLALDPQEKHSCQVCQNDDKILINCIECDFIICLKCVSVPYMVRYKHDTHFLTLVHEKETNEPNWCEVCERLLISSEEEKRSRREEEKGEDVEDKRFYECKQCCTTLHINCLLGNVPYLKPGHTVINSNVQILANNSLSRPSCDCCEERCVDKIFLRLVLKTATFVTCCLDNALYVTQ